MPATVYADASGGKDQPLCLVAGWYNSDDNWSEFARKWKSFLRGRDIEYLHQTKSKDPSNDLWKKDPANREAVLAEAFSIIDRSGASSFIFLTPTDVFEEYAKEQSVERRSMPPCFEWNAFRFIAVLHGWCRDNRLALPELVFEASEKREQRRLRSVVSQFELPAPVFRTKLDDDPIRATVALQAADFLAYEVFRGWRDIQNTGRTERRYLRMFYEMPGRRHWSWADKDKMDQLIPVSETEFRLAAIAAARAQSNE